MPFYPAKGGNSGKNLRVFWGGMNVRSDTYSDKMPTDTDLNILYEFEAQTKPAFPWTGAEQYVTIRIYRISEKAKRLKRIRMRAFHHGQQKMNLSLSGYNCTVTTVSEAGEYFDTIFDVTDITGDFSKVAIVNSKTNFITGFEIIEAE